jgi:hypothetical protein
LYFPRTKCFFNPDMGSSSYSDLRGFNIAPRPSETEDDNWAVLIHILILHTSH